MIACGGGVFTHAPRENIHTFVRLRFTFAANPDLKKLGDVLDALGQFRNKADYDLSPLAIFHTSNLADQVIHDAAAALALLDAIETDPARRSAAISAIQKAFP